MLHSQAEPGHFPFKVRGAFTPDLAHRKARQARRRGLVVQRGGGLRHAQRHAGAQGFHGPEGGEKGGDGAEETTAIFWWELSDFARLMVF